MVSKDIQSWAGLFGGMAAASLFAVAVVAFEKMQAPRMPEHHAWSMGLMGILFAVFVTVLAQSGDFFESWLKRRAGVKARAGAMSRSSRFGPSSGSMAGHICISFTSFRDN